MYAVTYVSVNLNNTSERRVDIDASFRLSCTVSEMSRARVNFRDGKRSKIKERPSPPKRYNTRACVCTNVKQRGYDGVNNVNCLSSSSSDDRDRRGARVIIALRPKALSRLSRPRRAEPI